MLLRSFRKDRLPFVRSGPSFRVDHQCQVTSGYVICSMPPARSLVVPLSGRNTADRVLAFGRIYSPDVHSESSLTLCMCPQPAYSKCVEGPHEAARATGPRLLERGDSRLLVKLNSQPSWLWQSYVHLSARCQNEVSWKFHNRMEVSSGTASAGGICPYGQ